MLLFSLTAVVLSISEGRGRVMAAWKVPVAAALAALAALILIAYPTWGELKNPSLWVFAIVAAVVGAGRGYLSQPGDLTDRRKVLLQNAGSSGNRVGECRAFPSTSRQPRSYSLGKEDRQSCLSFWEA